MSRLVFEPLGHRYVLDGIVRESVTQILDGLGVIDPDNYPESARIRGTKVHMATAMLESPGGLDYSSLKPIEDALGEPIVPYVKAWALFLRESGWKSEKIEHRNFHKLYLYPGTTDRIGHFYGRPPASRTVLDIKTGGIEKYMVWQTGAYAEMERSHDGVYLRRMIVQLFATGKYKIHHHDDPQDGPEFLNLLGAYRAGRKKGYFKSVVDHDIGAKQNGNQNGAAGPGTGSDEHPRRTEETVRTG